MYNFFIDSNDYIININCLCGWHLVKHF